MAAVVCEDMSAVRLPELIEVIDVCFECSVEKKIVGRGLCNNCYHRLRRAGRLDEFDLIGQMNRPETVCARPDCGIEFNYKLSQNRKYCSLECYLDHRKVVVTSDQIEKARLTRERHGTRLGPRKGYKQTEQHAANVRAVKMANGTFTHSAHATEYNGMLFRSRTEARTAELLDRAGIDWVYEPQRFRLSWCVYVPDFYLPNFDIWVEVKGWLDPVSERKIESFRHEKGKTLTLATYQNINYLYEGGK